MVITKWAIKSLYSSKYLSKNKWGHVRSARLFSRQEKAESHMAGKGFILGIDYEVVPIQTISPDGPALPPNSLYSNTLSLTKLRSEYYNEQGIDIGVISERRMYGIVTWNWMDATSRLRTIDRSQKSKTFVISMQDTLELEDYIFYPVGKIAINFIMWVLTRYGVEYDGVLYAKIKREVDWAKPEKL